MPIPSPVAVKFCNEKIRVAADMLAQLDNFAGAVLAEWTAMGGSAAIPNAVGNVVQDGASPNGVDAVGGDGRPVIDGAKVNGIINRLTELRSAVAATGLALGAVGVRNTVLQVAVNTVKG